MIQKTKLKLIHSIDKLMILVQQYNAGFITRAAFSLALATRLDEHREEIQEYIDKPTLIWPPELIAIVRRVGATGVKNDLLHALVQSSVKTSMEKIESLKAKGYDVTELEETIKQELKIKGILLEGKIQ